jgi:hypothetical protein
MGNTGAAAHPNKTSAKRESANKLVKDTFNIDLPSTLSGYSPRRV